MCKRINQIAIHSPRTIGSLFLLAFLAYGVGRGLFESGAESEKYIGALMIGANSIIVLVIGVLLRKTLLQHNVATANIYLTARTCESVALASILLNLLPSVTISYDLGYFIAMFVLGVGSVPMCVTLYKQKLAPPWLALWGAVGYAVFAFGFLLEFFGINWSMYLLAPGGLWEVTFALWLIIKASHYEKSISIDPDVS